MSSSNQIPYPNRLANHISFIFYNCVASWHDNVSSEEAVSNFEVLDLQTTKFMNISWTNFVPESFVEFYP